MFNNLQAVKLRCADFRDAALVWNTVGKQCRKRLVDARSEGVICNYVLAQKTEARQTAATDLYLRRN